ncbi:hypothetical protein CEXT_191251 [Caerostris extrusa]|uniref:Uncharacterized protein n=1 Tax=Caerostris extrusa TaxID=172846 RepID=A0AAV4N7I5_CAEEX|nr:hypothetical protein CEXT_191251 [Caerostris extrusa]
METSTKLDETMNFTALNMTEEDLCLKERKWWCFLLSSVITCLVGIFIILFWRACVFMCCSSKSTNASSSQAASRLKFQERTTTRAQTAAKKWRRSDS